MTDARSTRRSYDAVADAYAAEVGGELAGKPLDRALLQSFVELAGSGVIADVGCGPGHVTTALAGYGADVVGFDLSPAMCALAAAGEVPVAAADMTALPVASGSLAGIACLYAVIHLSAAQRLDAYREFARALRPGGVALVSFHTSDVEQSVGSTKVMTQWWGHDVELTFHYLDADAEAAALASAGLAQFSRLDREPHPAGEHQSRRSYLIVRREP